MMVRAHRPLGNKRPWWSTLHLDRPTSDPDWPTWLPDELHFFEAQFHPHWPFIQSLKIFKEVSFNERPTMETRGCSRTRKRGWDMFVWEMVENWMVFIGRECLYRLYLPLMESKKTSFLTWPLPKMFEKRFLCGADHRPNESDAVQIT